MTCDEVQDLIEAVAAGDEAPGPGFEAHVAGCGKCAAALASARRIERALAAHLPAASAPMQFSRDVIAAVRRERWRYEQHVDRAFNLSIGLGVAIVVLAAVSLLNLTNVTRILLAAFETLAEAGRQPTSLTSAGSVPTVAWTTAVFATAIGIWWWAERRSDAEPGSENPGIG